MNLSAILTAFRNRFPGWFAIPRTTETVEARGAIPVQYFLLIVGILSLPFSVYLARTGPTPDASIALVLIFYALLAVYLLLAHRGYIGLVRVLFPYSIWALVTLTAFLIYGEVNTVPVDAYVLVILVGGLLLNWRHGFALVGLSLLAVAGLLMITPAGPDPSRMASTDGIRTFVYYLLIYILAAALVHLTTNRIQTALRKAEGHEEILQQQNRELEKMRLTLEERVEERTTEILRQKNLLQTLVDINPIAIVKLDTDSRIVAWNTSFESMFGYDSGELEGARLDDLVTDEGNIEEALNLTSCVSGGVSIRELGTRRRKNGEPIQVEIFGVPVIVGGEQVGLLALYNDITERVMAEQALRESETQNKALFANITDPVLIFDKETLHFLDANPAAISRYGYSKEEFLTLTPVALHPQEERGQAEKSLLDRTGPSTFVRTHLTRAGERMTVEIRTAELEYRGRPAWISFVQDISERAASERALRDSEEKLRSIIEQSYDSILLTDEDGVITVWNQAQESLTGMTAEEALGRPLWELEKFINLLTDGRSGRNGGRQHTLKEMLGGGESTSLTEPREWEILQPDGTRRYAQSVIFPVETEDGYLAGAITRDITERKLIEQRFEYLATHDWLTNLPNRSLFQDRLAHALSIARREGTQVVVVFLDLDGFKKVNDAFGHARGDELLKDVATRLRSCLRGSDTVARLGGDEFTFVLENISSRDSVGTVIDKIRTSLSNRFLVHGNEFGISASIGVSIFPQDADSPELLLKYADQAMYRAKQSGKNHTVFFS
ncbi:MAG TPA: PAS domain S-box protein [Anaerolineales bacterium]|nr:PAS domain S-box protein [Anaerolineales bacterium]